MKSLPIFILIALVVGCTEPQRSANDVKPRTDKDSTTAAMPGVALDFDTTVVDNTTELDVF